LAVNRTIRMWSTVVKRFNEERTMEAAELTQLHEADWASIDSLMSRMVDLRDLSKRIAMALDDDYSSSSGDSSTSEDLQANDDKLANAPPNNADSTLWPYGKWTIKPEYFVLLSLSAHVLRKFE